MPITKLTEKSFGLNSISSSKIADGSVTASKILFQPNDEFILPSGPQSDRPASPNTGSFRFNSESNRFELFNGIEWVQQ